MIDWNSEDWGGKVHLAANGSWVADKHGDDTHGDDGHWDDARGYHESQER